MVHGPCGQLNRSSPCMLDNSCSKKYPKEYSEETLYISDNGYPTYRRPNNGLVANVRGHPVGNEFVVPYNPYLLVNYINSRYVSPPEAVWRLFSYEMHNKSHTIVRLPVHLENYHNVYFEPGQVLERVQNAAAGSN
ncbi:uncharacterized protein LOC126555048 [Aphis gossypii]|uniref:uncharacterized protein LOC126555048 n=1 Tax=Aphis gossypii TaxID=80765 RepID=UPI0021590342|nr:uncharacterized protein LOC126555048 [Aphis gossypii]